MKNWQKLKNDPSLFEKFFVKEYIFKAIRKFFEERKYHEFECPILSDCLPQERYLDVLSTIVETKKGKNTAYLIPTTETFNKRLLATGIGNHFVISKLAKKHTHPQREIETELGDLFADSIAESVGSDIAMIGSGSIRSNSLGPIVNLMDLTSCFPYDDSLTRFTITGRKIWKIFEHVMRKENRTGEGECYQVNSAVKAEFDEKQNKLLNIEINGEKLKADKLYTLTLQGFHQLNSNNYLNISDKELREDGEAKVVTTSAKQVLEEYLRSNQNISKEVEGRLVYK